MAKRVAGLFGAATSTRSYAAPHAERRVPSGNVPSSPSDASSRNDAVRGGARLTDAIGDPDAVVGRTGKMKTRKPREPSAKAFEPNAVTDDRLRIGTRVAIDAREPRRTERPHEPFEFDPREVDELRVTRSRDAIRISRTTDERAKERAWSAGARPSHLLETQVLARIAASPAAR